MANEIIKERMLRNMLENIGNHFDNNNPYEALREIYLEGYGNDSCCIHDKYLDEDIMNSIFDKVYVLLDSVRTELEDCLSKHDHIEIVIVPSYDDKTSFMLQYKTHAIFSDDLKMWHFIFGDIEELKDELYNIYRTASEKLNTFKECNIGERQLDDIRRLYIGYYNTGQDVSQFASEFFFMVGVILKGNQELKDLDPEFLILDEIL